MSFQIGAMIGGLLLVVVAALWGMRGLRAELGLASEGYRELRDRYEVGFHVATAKMLLQGERADVDRAVGEIQAALTKLDLLESHHAAIGDKRDEGLRASLKAAGNALKLPKGSALGGGPEAAVDVLNRALGQITAASLGVRKRIADSESAAHEKWRKTLVAVGIISLVVVVVCIALGVRQYRGVIVPLRRLGEAANRIAAGKLAERVDARGPAEFAEIANDFNVMAKELEALYRDLEQKVAATSRELVRSERLASVGHLAAGVAHEINNPLSVITGYAERAIQQLEKGNGDAAGEPSMAMKNLRIICEEAYRCKEITQKLLALARPGREDEAARQEVALGALVRDVVALVEGLPIHRERVITVQVVRDATVLASANELKQVLLNLLVNALEAVPTGSGKVSVRVDRVEESALVTMTDNGRGMTGEVLEKVFEPFFTDKRGSPHPGTGLGLSIAHAIVQSHRGRLTARSEGSGRGSVFEVELPVAGSV